MKIYVASSWRNDHQPDVIVGLREVGHEVYDFRNPPSGGNGFHWSEIDPNWKTWTAEQYRECLNHPLAAQGFSSDFAAMQWAEAFVGVMPFGRSASFEMGWAVGNDKRTILLLSDGEPELMVKLFDFVCTGMGEVLLKLQEWEDDQ